MIAHARSGATGWPAHARSGAAGAAHSRKQWRRRAARSRGAPQRGGFHVARLSGVAFTWCPYGKVDESTMALTNCKGGGLGLKPDQLDRAHAVLFGWSDGWPRNGTVAFT
jgi:hypothetical protein